MMLAKQYLNKEVICLMDNNNLNNIGFNTSYSTNEVRMSDNMIRALLYGNTTFTAIHNHVDDNTFSLIDVVTFLTYAKLTTMIICTNSCKYSAACYKNKRIPNLIIHINQVINFMISKGVVDGHKSGLSLIKILSKLGILYVEYINY